MEMREVKISTLEGDALDWAVGKAAGFNVSLTMAFPSNGSPGMVPWDDDENRPCRYSRGWKQLGPLMERYTPILTLCQGQVRAEVLHGIGMGDSYRVALCRAIVDAHSATGTVMVPVELLEGDRG